MYPSVPHTGAYLVLQSHRIVRWGAQDEVLAVAAAAAAADEPLPSEAAAVVAAAAAAAELSAHTTYGMHAANINKPEGKC